MIKNLLAVLIIVAIVISLAGVFLVLNTNDAPDVKIAAGTAKVNVIAASNIPASTGQAIVNVIENTEVVK
ncbi:MAG: hypothetical protein U9R08_04585 [Nanoarchaeota archaeon]|nr:hypothetical protein [Nanoarchaeota archaeon]